MYIQSWKKFAEGGNTAKFVRAYLTIHARVTHDCGSILDSVAKKTSCYSHTAPLHHYSFSCMIFALVYTNI